MATFSERAFAEGWIEVEDRQGKRPGGFCTSLPLSEQTRIFMTFSGTADNVSTLAHELGHAYHQHVMDDMPMLLQDYAMNVAETASTLAEMIVMEATIQQATTKEEKISLLDQKIQNAVAFYMNIHARYLFETRFYALRKQGLVSSEQLDELMVEAQKEAYTDALSEYHKSFWASKLHFYITEVPFYNFPYTFGYLFSAGLYAYSQTTTDFEEKYIALLRDTGNMSVEQLAMKHLQVDVTTPAFWRDAVAYTVKDVELFLELTKEV
jgi:oligoendopeptidase F